jgi:O-antigen ligase
MPFSRDVVFKILAVFAATATASVALQNLFWVAVSLWLWNLYRTKEKPAFGPRDFLFASIAFTASFFLSALLGTNPGQSFKSVHKYLILLAYLPIVALEFNPERIRRFLFWFLAGSAVCAAWGSSRYFLGLTTRITSFSGNWMVFGGLLMLSLLIGLFLLRETPKNPWLWIFTALTALGLLLTQTRGAWLACLVGVFLMAWRFNRRLIPLGLVLLVLGYFLMPATFQSRVHSLFEASASDQQNNSNHERILILKSGWAMIKDHPFFGIGQGTMESVYPKYRLPGAWEQAPGHLHNTPLQILAQNGAVGFLFYLVWLATYARNVWKYRPPNPSTADLHWLLTCLFAVTFLWGLTEYSFSQQFMSVQFFLIGLQVGLWKTGTLGGPIEGEGR